MEPAEPKIENAVGVARFLNRRVIKTPYVRSAIYFAIAVAVSLLFYFLVLAR
jgi:hypothetical protein